MKGSPVKNLPAVETCNQRGWRVGTVLLSERWSYPRRIDAFKGAFVVLRTLYRPEMKVQQARALNGTFVAVPDVALGARDGSPERVRSLPSDVRKLEQKEVEDEQAG